MAFEVQNLNLDLMNGTANVVMLDQATQSQIKAVSLQFPFSPNGGQAYEREKVRAEAKVVLQEVINAL